MEDKEDDLKDGYINLDFKKFNPVKNSAITFKVDYGRKPKFEIKCDK